MPDPNISVSYSPIYSDHYFSHKNGLHLVLTRYEICLYSAGVLNHWPSLAANFLFRKRKGRYSPPVTLPSHSLSLLRLACSLLAFWVGTCSTDETLSLVTINTQKRMALLCNGGAGNKAYAMNKCAECFVVRCRLQ